MSKPKVVLDTNIFISGVILDHGYSYQILQAWKDNQFNLFLSQELLDEYLSVIQRPKLSKYLRFTPNDTDQLTFQLSQHLITTTKPTKPTALRDSKDRFILDLCRSVPADYLVTGDKDLLTLPKTTTFKIVTPAQFCALLGI